MGAKQGSTVLRHFCPALPCHAVKTRYVQWAADNKLKVVVARGGGTHASRGKTLATAGQIRGEQGVNHVRHRSRLINGFLEAAAKDEYIHLRLFSFSPLNFYLDLFYYLQLHCVSFLSLVVFSGFCFLHRLQLQLQLQLHSTCSAAYHIPPPFNPKTAPPPKLPSRRALAGIALVSVVSAVEKQRRKNNNNKDTHLATQDMSGELQTIPARHGVATFVPRGRTIKVINTYGKQVVSMWAFTLGPPPEEGEGMGEGEVVEKEVGEEEVRREAEGLKMAVEEEGKKEDGMGSEGGKESEDTKESGDIKKETEDGEEERDGDKENEDGKESKDDKESEDSKQSEKGAETQPSEDKTNETTQDAKDLPKQTPDAPEPEKTAETTTSSSQQPVKRTWASYLPSIPYRNKGTATKQEVEQKPSPEQEKKQNEENTKKWSSYLPTGKSFSSYVPNVEVPDSKSVLSAFKASHYRDPNKSYAEQLYDFSKTPVGAGTMAGT